METSALVIQELTFLTRQTGQDEVTLLGHALRVGLEMLYRQAVEQAYIDGTLARDDAAAILGRERVEEIEYAKQALAQDIERGLRL